jgi:Skp family chaperone for outer membrane proteins
MNKFAIGAALAALSIAALPTAASAQRLGPAVIAVVDTQRIFTECTACRAAQTQLQQQVQQAQQRAQQLNAPLQTEETAIQTALRALNGKQPDAALQTRIRNLQTQGNTAQTELANRQRTLQSTQAHVNQQIGTRLGPIVNTVMNNRGATLVVDKNTTLANAPALDVTNEVLAALNQQLPSVSVTPLPQQQQQQQPQGR